MEQQRKVIHAPDNGSLMGLFGSLDENMIKIEKAFSVHIVNREDGIHIIGGAGTSGAEAVIRTMVKLAEKSELIDDQKVNYLINTYVTDAAELNDIERMSDDTVCLTVSGKPIKAKTLGQKRYIELMRKNTVVFSVGPAGTGKTYLSMAMAVAAFKRGDVSRIILTRPAIEAGEKLGFLPGDLQQKVDPYLRPLYDALYDIMGSENFLKNMEKNAVEVAPLAYMRGRTLDNSFIVLDEAQNTTAEQMKMFLTRIGMGSKAVVTGDITQIDLPEGKRSGLKEAVRILKNIDGIGISLLTNKDVVRHPLVQQIINAYESYEHKKRIRAREGRKT
ncbi:MAG: PhoH family protein [Clostridiales bacterium]|jgi:phosphate starvation-inducible PhoH-like protein|nr:PhoH family protein [Clostridiales bacterium]